MTYSVKDSWEFDEITWHMFDMLEFITQGFVGPIQPHKGWTYQEYLNVINGDGLE